MVNWGGGAKGAASGAALGSVAGPYGAAVGGVVGGLYGLFGGDDDEGSKGKQYADRGQIMNTINQGFDGVNNRSAPQVGNTYINQAPQDQFRQQQLSQVHRLNAIAGGQQMGAGEMAARRAASEAYARQVGMANMQRGGGAPYAGVAAARNQTMIAGNAAGQAQQAALGDQSAANAQLTQAIGAGRGQDIGLAQNQAQINQQTMLNNANLKMQQMGLDDQTRLAYLQQLANMNATELTGQNAAAVAGQQQNNALLGAGISAAGSILAARMGNRGASPALASGGNSGFTGESNWGA